MSKSFHSIHAQLTRMKFVILEEQTLRNENESTYLTTSRPSKEAPSIYYVTVQWLVLVSENRKKQNIFCNNSSHRKLKHLQSLPLGQAYRLLQKQHIRTLRKACYRHMRQTTKLVSHMSKNLQKHKHTKTSCLMSEDLRAAYAIGRSSIAGSRCCPKARQADGVQPRSCHNVLSPWNGRNEIEFSHANFKENFVPKGKNIHPLSPLFAIMNNTHEKAKYEWENFAWSKPLENGYKISLREGSCTC